MRQHVAGRSSSSSIPFSYLPAVATSRTTNHSRSLINSSIPEQQLGCSFSSNIGYHPFFYRRGCSTLSSGHSLLRTHARSFSTHHSSQRDNRHQAQKEKGDAHPYLFFAENTQFKDLGLSESALAMARRDQKTTPSRIQALAIPPILSGQSVRIGAETGSGKTLAYLLPVLHQVIESERRRIEAEKRKEEKEKQQQAKEATKDSTEPTQEEEQLTEAMKKLRIAEKVWKPQVVIFVPHTELCQQVGSVLASLLQGTKLTYKCLIQKDELLSEDVSLRPNVLVTTLYNFLNNIPKVRGLVFPVRHVIVDEADMLLSGAYQYHMRKFLEKLKKYDEEDFAAMREMWIPRQYIFAAATLPNLGKSSLTKFLKSTFPDMVNISTDMLHHQVPNLKQEWYSVESASKRNTQLIELLKKVEVERTLIFVNSVKSADDLQTFLADQGIKGRCFHKDVPVKVRELSLQKFREGTAKVMICTDLAARGIDFKDVGHVIQFEFAASTIDHIHRVGRTARAGAPGLASNFFGPKDKALVNAIRQAGTQEGNLDSTFKQVERRKLKRQQKSQPELFLKNKDKDEEEDEEEEEEEERKPQRPQKKTSKPKETKEGEETRRAFKQERKETMVSVKKGDWKHQQDNNKRREERQGRPSSSEKRETQQPKAKNSDRNRAATNFDKKLNRKEKGEFKQTKKEKHTSDTVKQKVSKVAH